MGFWLKLIGGLFAYNVAKKHIATKNDHHSLSQVWLTFSTEMAAMVIGSPAPAR